jgi:hypothetical protein
MKGVPLRQTNVLMNSQHVSAKIGHQQVFLERYTKGDGIHIKYDVITKCAQSPFVYC